MLELFPEGFEEVDGSDGVELVAYTDGAGQERFAAVFGAVAGRDIASDWHDRWRLFHRGARVGPLWVGPPWEDAPPDLIPVVVDPGRAFGTGAHPTTRLCLELLAEISRGSLVDVGCGSGVIAIAAVKLGFSPVTGVDVDPQAVQVARQNAAANGVELAVLTLDARTGGLPETDVAVANIALDSVEDLGGVLHARHAVTSGYLVSEQPMLDGYRIRERRERDGWAADLYERR
jgi:ribosomal protein L11 methyltransferase